MQPRKASIKETGEELPPAEWERFDAAVAQVKAERKDHPDCEPERDAADGEHRPETVGHGLGAERSAS